MKNRLNEEKDNYNDIKIPDNLSEVVENAIKISSINTLKSRIMKGAVSAVAASILLMAILVIGLQSSQSFAQKASKMPLLSQLVHLVTTVSYDERTKYYESKVKIPEVTGLENSVLEHTLNEKILDKMLKHIEKGKIRAKEYYQAYTETGGKEENYRPVILEVDYSIKSTTDAYISFEVYYFEALGSSYSKTYYYTYAIEDQKILTLKDIFGESYVEILNSEIQYQMNQQINEGSASYFSGVMGFKSIEKNQKFYINDQKQVVIVFDKYTIAPGASGEPEFIIPRN